MEGDLELINKYKIRYGIKNLKTKILHRCYYNTNLENFVL